MTVDDARLVYHPSSEDDKPGVIKARPCHLCVKVHALTVLPMEFKLKGAASVFTHYAECKKSGKHYLVYFPEGRCVAHPQMNT